eukprot:13320883-Alexandrium_andersonii.AAC.1
MSASLVGSEMCIRDRRVTSRSSWCLAPSASRHRFPGGASRGGSSREVPVSYTHLTLPTICSV